jgi:hypothetical protein
VERAEAKVFANRERYKSVLITQPLRRAYSKLFMFSAKYQDILRMYMYIYIYVLVISPEHGSIAVGSTRILSWIIATIDQKE